MSNGQRAPLRSLQTWNYDRYGNWTGFSQNIAGLTAAPNPTVDANTNRFNTGQGFTYDKNGNVIADIDSVTNQTRSFAFNGDNKQTQVKDANGNTIGQYYYDGEGKRVKKFIAATNETTVFVYSSGKLVAEYSTTVAPVENAQVAYTTTDHLGSPRVITGKFGDVISRRDFLPFGEEIVPNVGSRTANLSYGTSDGVRQKFTGYQKDTETSLDFAEARMYENRFGRFTAVDPLLVSGKSANPQTFNRYLYVRNSPLADNDPSGECPQRQCPDTHTGLVYTKKIGDKVHYQNERIDDSWEIFTGNVLMTDVANGKRYRIFGDGTFGGSGWRHIPVESESIQSFLGNFDDAANDKITGMMRGTANFAIGAWNSSTQPGGIIFAPLVQNPFAVSEYGYDNARQAGWGTATQIGWGAGTVLGGSVFGAGSSLSIVPESRAALNTEQLLTRAATIAERRVGGTGPVQGTFKHQYATKLLERYQNRFGDRGLEFNNYFNNGPGNRGFLDVINNRTNIIYDFKFGNASMKSCST